MTNKEKQILKNAIYDARVAELIYSKMDDSVTAVLRTAQTSGQCDGLRFLAGDLGLNELVTQAYKDAQEYYSKTR